MKKYLSAAAIAVSMLIFQNSVVAQDDKDKSKNKLGEYDEIIVKRKDAGKDGKVTIEIKDGEVKVNGKPLEEYEDESLSVRRKKTLNYGLTSTSPFRSQNFNFSNDLMLGEERPFLGVSTDDVSGGARITSVTSNSAAEKAGLKKGDIITRINDASITDHGDITKVIRSLKAEDKVAITYKRDGKENKVTATLGKRNTSPIYEPHGDVNFDFNHDGQFDRIFSYGGRPRIGIKAQDTEDGKGVKVIDVDEGSAADKSGVKEDDVITEFDGKAINSADELAAASREAKDKTSMKLKVNRGGNSQTIEVKIPRKLKTANL